MTRLRQGFLSDENMMKECTLHHPVPMNRLDLLPRPMENRSGLYYRPLKETKIIARPQSAGVMLEATERLTGNNLKADYMTALKEEPKIVKFPTYPNTLPDTQGIRVAPNVGNAYSIATIAYNALASQAGIPSLSSGMSSSVPSPPVSVVDSATTLSEGDTATIPESLPSEPELTEMPMGTQTGESGREVIPTTEPPKITKGRISTQLVKRPELTKLGQPVRQPGETDIQFMRRVTDFTKALVAGMSEEEQQRAGLIDIQEEEEPPQLSKPPSGSRFKPLPSETPREYKRRVETTLTRPVM